MTSRNTKLPIPRNELYHWDEGEKVLKPVQFTEDGKLKIAGYDERDDATTIKSMQKKWRAGFTGQELNPSKWEIIQVGAGQSITVNNGELQVHAGTVANAETIFVSKQEFTVPMRAMMNVKLSQRIANQEFFVELVSTDKETGEITSHSCAGWQFDGTSATSAKYYTNGGDQPTTLSALSTIVSTTTGIGGIYEIEPTSDETWFFSRTADATSGRTNSYVRHSQIPSPSLKYRLQIRVKNGSVAPASNTIFYSQFANISDYTELTAEITGGRGTSVAGQGIFATVAGSLTSVTTAYTSPKSVYNTDTVANLNAGALFSGTVRDLGATPLYRSMMVRVISNRNGRLDIRVGTSSTLTANPINFTYDVRAGEVLNVEVPLVARYAGLQFTNTDTTATTELQIHSRMMG